MRPLIYQRLRAGGSGQLPSGTMNLLPGWDFRGNDPCSDSSKVAGNKEAGMAQMTIFYAGEVVVFEDFPALGAAEVVTMASKVSFFGAIGPNPANLLPLVKKPVPRPTEPVPRDLPIARRASLHHFLEKRKGRLAARAPYEKAGNASGPADNKSWLGKAAWTSDAKY